MSRLDLTLIPLRARFNLPSGAYLLIYRPVSMITDRLYLTIWTDS